jgi:pimeloyl-ACP methyl ester carboxylesterase
MDRHFVNDCNGIRMRYVESGRGQPIVFLHGFPDFSYSWRHQFPALSGAGWRCLAPDLRGYNETDKPRAISAYNITELVRDIAAFIDKVAGGNAVVVGHDWGGVIAWYLAMRSPTRVRKLIIMNAPHPAAYRRELRRGKQLLRSWYIGAVQLPLLPELVLSSLHFRLLTRGAARSEPERVIYEEALSQPNALTSALNYYRAAVRSLWHGEHKEISRITMSTLVLWGQRDAALVPELLDGLEQHVDDLTVIRFPDVGHWVHIDAAQRVNAELLNFLR